MPAKVNWTLEKVRENCVETPSGCWEWQRARVKGYGYITVDYKNRYVHRMVAEMSGLRVDGVDVLHSCDNPPCCNPAHLRLGDAKENAKDMKERTFKTCRRGHEDWGLKADGFRYCRACQRWRRSRHGKDGDSCVDYRPNPEAG